jgi:CDP-diacylglycerol--glycerol-3-phosphate 3-phosphatidyltransferase
MAVMMLYQLSINVCFYKRTYFPLIRPLGIVVPMTYTLKANHLTFFRIGAVPLIALLICLNGWLAALLALLLYIAAAVSDWFDGYLARKYNDTSLLGQVFDIVADKLLVVGCLLGLGVSGRLGGMMLPALAIVLREIFVMGLREYAVRKAERDNEEAPATTMLGASELAKAKTMVEMVAIGVLIAIPHLLPMLFGAIGCFLLWIAAGLSLYTGYQYFQQARFMPAKTGN